ncbi:MAG: hypothetical protein V6Z82_02290 [Flavobacteriales bacterium]
MRNLLIYYIAILLPIPLIYWGLYHFGATFVLVALLSYAMIYRKFTDGKRLMEKGLLRKADFWKFAIIPFWHSFCIFRYFRELYFEK